MSVPDESAAVPHRCWTRVTCTIHARDLAGSTNAVLEDLRYPAARATLAFDTNAHSLAELTATNPVTLTVILYNSALALSNYSGTLYQSADEPLVLIVLPRRACGPARKVRGGGGAGACDR